MEVSFAKPVLDLQDGRLQGAEGPDSWKSAQAKWSNMQLRVLLLTGGNEQFADYMNQYDLMTEKVQTRYSSTAAQYYRDNLKLRMYGNSCQGSPNLIKQQPDYATGRKHHQNGGKIAP